LSLWLPPLVIATALFVLSHHGTLPVEAPTSDLVAHAIAYCVLGLLVVRALHGGLRPLRWRPAVASVVITTVYGATDEWHQSFVPGRTPSLADLAADGVGALIAVGLFALLHRLFGKSSPDGGFSPT